MSGSVIVVRLREGEEEVSEEMVQNQLCFIYAEGLGLSDQEEDVEDYTAELTIQVCSALLMRSKCSRVAGSQRGRGQRRGRESVCCLPGSSPNSRFCARNIVWTLIPSSRFHLILPGCIVACVRIVQS